MAGNSKQPPANPLVQALLKRPGRTVELTGYAGPAELGWVRLYADLGLQRYIDIPESAVASVRQPVDDPTAPCTVFFDTSAEIKYTVAPTIFRADDMLRFRLAQAPSDYSPEVKARSRATVFAGNDPCGCNRRLEVCADLASNSFELASCIKEAQRCEFGCLFWQLVRWFNQL